MVKVGMLEGCFYDQERTDWADSAPRPLRYTCWYPTDTAEEENEILIGPPDQPMFRMGRAIVDAPLSGATTLYPVALISHGTGGAAGGMGWLGCRLAARGYVALVVSHHGNTVLEPYLPEGFLCWWERAEDMSVALDNLLLHSLFQDRLDTGRVFAAGFSLGGYAVMALAGALTDRDRFSAFMAARPGEGPGGPKEFPDLVEHVDRLMESRARFRASYAVSGDSYLDPRVQAVFACAPAPTVRAFTDESLATITVPIAIVCGENDLEAPHLECACWLAERIDGCELSLLGENVGHYVFLCEATEQGKRLQPDICLDPEEVDRRTIHDGAAERALRLFEQAAPATE